MSVPVPITGSPAVEVEHAVERALEFLLAKRYPEGYWCAELTSDTTLESDFILLELWQHPPQGGRWDHPAPDLIRKAASSILERQLPDGGFWIYPGGPADVSATVKAYFALKLAGLPPDDARMRAARRRILELGGLQAANSYVKINLSFFGLYPREHVPSVPVEMMLMPGNFVYQMSSWTRTIVIPLAIIQALNDVRPVPEGFTLDELIRPDRSLGLAKGDERGWKRFWLFGDRLLKLWGRHGSERIRRLALLKAERWLLEHLEDSDGLGAIYPAMMYAVMALDALGYRREDPVRAEAERQFYRLMVDDGERFFFQPCFSPVWDTAIAAFAVGEAAPEQARSLRDTADWLLSKEVRRRGDWAVKRPKAEPGGWYFEFANEFYPDIDDTAMVLLALRRLEASDPERKEAAARRAIAWLLAMQSKDGGWAAFDADNDWQILSEVPFADHNAMLDPTCPDITGRVIEALCAWGLRDHPAVRRGVEYLRRTQRLDGSWYGRWGVNHIYGTFLALRGLRAAGVDPNDASILRAAEWLRSIQNADGGWGESCASYDAGDFVAAESTASQTAWAVLGLLAAGDVRSESVHHGVRRLLETQNEDGTWQEDLATGTGFPRVFYLTYHLYRHYFPLLALARYRKAQEEA